MSSRPCKHVSSTRFVEPLMSASDPLKMSELRTRLGMAVAISRAWRDWERSNDTSIPSRTAVFVRGTAASIQPGRQSGSNCRPLTYIKLGRLRSASTLERQRRHRPRQRCRTHAARVRSACARAAAGSVVALTARSCDVVLNRVDTRERGTTARTGSTTVMTKAARPTAHHHHVSRPPRKSHRQAA